MKTSLQEIARKARQNKRHRFTNLYGILNERFLIESWFELNRKSAPGFDRVTAKEYSENLRVNIKNLIVTLKEKRYRAGLVRRKDIPKGNGKTRSLGIPTTEDKLVQKGVVRILTAFFEQDFLSNSFGYRPNMGAGDAVQDVTINLQRKRFSYIVDADIKGFFDNIDHEWLIKMLEQRIDDKAFIRLMRKWLKAGILTPENLVLSPVTGTQQGGIVSPILANIYLHYVLDLWFEKMVKPRCEGEAYLCRYADDFIAAFRYARDAEKFYKVLGKRINKFGLEIAKDKTKIIKFTRFKKESGTCFEFLGFEFRWGVDRKGSDLIQGKTSRSKLGSSLKNFREWCKENI